MSARERWADQLEGWAIPPAILEAAPESPWGFDVGMFTQRAKAAAVDTPSAQRAREALPDGGSVLDVGCGGGAGGFALVPPAGLVTGVDEQRGMLDAFATRGAELGVRHDEVEGRWPDVASQTPDADVVVCHHVVHNVADLAPFAVALTEHARRRVVVEMSATHPLSWLRPYWQRVHGLDRPEGPTDDDAALALAEAGIDARRESFHWAAFLPTAEPEVAVGFIRRRLCLPADRDDEVRAAIADLGLPASRRLTALWWDR